MSTPTYSNGVRNLTTELDQYGIRAMYARCDMNRDHRLLCVPIDSIDAPECLPAGSVVRCDAPTTRSAFTHLPTVFRGI